LYISSRNIEIYDLTNPFTPVKITEIDNYYYFKDLFVLGELLYGINVYGITVYNISALPILNQVGYFRYDGLNNIPEGSYEYSHDEWYNIMVYNNSLFGLFRRIGFFILGEDNDHDKLADYLEETIYFTNSSSFDTDDDLMSDYYEITYGLDPFNDIDATFDNDSDGLSNVDESLRCTNPFSSDTDHDTILDQNEVLYNTDPVLWDTDTDGLSDGLEVFIVDLDPTLYDTDGDNFSDFWEVVNYRSKLTFWFYIMIIPMVLLCGVVTLIGISIIVSKIVKTKKLKKK